jgi:hypothetical protein
VPRHQRHHDIAVAHIGGSLQQDEVAVADVVVDHGIAAHFQREGVAAGREVA